MVPTGDFIWGRWQVKQLNVTSNGAVSKGQLASLELPIFHFRGDNFYPLLRVLGSYVGFGALDEP